MSSLLLAAALRSRAAAFGQMRCCSHSQLGQTISYSPEVQRARADGRPLVALESTIITHGMPYPHNLETATQVENIIRERGATPATVAILGGRLHVGLSEDQLKYLAQAKGVVKASRRDLAPVMATKRDGATTVAGTIVAAELADIPIFVTGGIGGVHREGEHTLDISADLTELGRSRTLVVCSGVKSILDIGRTLEYLETQGVCVCSFGASDDFPAFYTARSGHRAPHRVQDASAAARLLLAAATLHLHSGIIVAVPLPQEHAMNEVVIDAAIDRALKEAESKGVRGKEVTPFVLAAVSKATAGASLAANIALIKNNARVGADIAVEFNKLRNAENLGSASNIGPSGATGGALGATRGIHTSSKTTVEASRSQLECVEAPLLPTGLPDGPVLVIGGANVDRTYHVVAGDVQLDGSTHACEAAVCAGGVARNIAEALWRMRGAGSVRLLTAIGDDADGSFIDAVADGLLLDGCVVKGGRTANYAAVLDARGECVLGLGDMALHEHVSPLLVDKHIEVLKDAPLVVIDGNAPQATINHVLQLCQRMQRPVFFEPTDRRKSVKTICSRIRVQFSSPNLNELRAMAAIVDPSQSLPRTGTIEEILQLSQTVSQMVNYILVTMGAEGVVVVRDDSVDGSSPANGKQKQVLKLRHYPVAIKNDVINVSGAGDCFASGFIHGMLSGLKEPQCIEIAMKASANALRTKNTVPKMF